MSDTVNSDGNLFGRFVALILIAGVAFGAKISCSSAVTVVAEPKIAPVAAPKPKPRVLKPVEKPLETALPPQ